MGVINTVDLLPGALQGWNYTILDQSTSVPTLVIIFSIIINAAYLVIFMEKKLVWRKIEPRIMSVEIKDDEYHVWVEDIVVDWGV